MANRKRNATEAGAVVLATLEAGEVLAAIRAAVKPANLLSVADAGEVADADDLAGEGAAAFYAGNARTAGDAVAAAVASLRASRAGGAVAISLDRARTESGENLADTLAAPDESGEVEDAPMVRRFAGGAVFAAVIGDGERTATLTLSTGEVLTGTAAILAARNLSLAEDTAGEHGAAAAARGAKNQAGSAARDLALADAVNAAGTGYGAAAEVARLMGWLTDEMPAADRAKVLNRARVALHRLGKRTAKGDTHSSRD